MPDHPKNSYFDKICAVTTFSQLSYNQKQINLTFFVSLSKLMMDHVLETKIYF